MAPSSIHSRGFYCPPSLSLNRKLITQKPRNSLPDVTTFMQKVRVEERGNLCGSFPDQTMTSMASSVTFPVSLEGVRSGNQFFSISSRVMALLAFLFLLQE